MSDSNSSDKTISSRTSSTLGKKKNVRFDEASLSGSGTKTPLASSTRRHHSSFQSNRSQRTLDNEPIDVDDISTTPRNDHNSIENHADFSTIPRNPGSVKRMKNVSLDNCSSSDSVYKTPIASSTRDQHFSSQSSAGPTPENSDDDDDDDDFSKIPQNDQNIRRSRIAHNPGSSEIKKIVNLDKCSSSDSVHKTPIASSTRHQHFSSQSSAGPTPENSDDDNDDDFSKILQNDHNITRRRIFNVNSIFEEKEKLKDVNNNGDDDTSLDRAEGGISGVSSEKTIDIEEVGSYLDLTTLSESLNTLVSTPPTTTSNSTTIENAKKSPRKKTTKEFKRQLAELKKICLKKRCYDLGWMNTHNVGREILNYATQLETSPPKHVTYNRWKKQQQMRNKLYGLSRFSLYKRITQKILNYNQWNKNEEKKDDSNRPKKTYERFLAYYEEKNQQQISDALDLSDDANSPKRASKSPYPDGRQTKEPQRTEEIVLMEDSDSPQVFYDQDSADQLKYQQQQMKEQLNVTDDINSSKLSYEFPFPFPTPDKRNENREIKELSSADVINSSKKVDEQFPVQFPNRSSGSQKQQIKHPVRDNFFSLLSSKNEQSSGSKYSSKRAVSLPHRKSQMGNVGRNPLETITIIGRKVDKKLSASSMSSSRLFTPYNNSTPVIKSPEKLKILSDTTNRFTEKIIIPKHLKSYWNSK